MNIEHACRCVSMHPSCADVCTYALDAFRCFYVLYRCLSLQALNRRGRRPLHLACRNGHLEVAIELLDHGADPSARDVEGVQVCRCFMLW